MTNSSVKPSRILDGVRNSKIHLDISSKLKQRSDSLLLGSIHAFTKQRHCRTFDVHHVERDFARFTVDGINRRINHQKESNKCVDFNSKFDEGEGWFQVCYGIEDPFHEFYNGDGESVSLITRFKRNLPIFDGFWHIENLLTWIDAIEDFFGEINPPEHLKCKIVWYKMKGAAYYWWKQLQNEGIEQGKEEIKSWSIMKELLISRFTPSNCSTKVHSESNCSKHYGTADLRISGASEGVYEGDGQSKEMRKGMPVKCVMEFPIISSNEATKDEDHVEEATDTTEVTHLKFNHDCSDTSVHFDADNEQPKQSTLLAGSSVLNFEFDQTVLEESQMESFVNGNTPTIKNSIAMLIKSTARIEHEKVNEVCWMAPEAIPPSLINHRPLMGDFVGPYVVQDCKFVKVRVVRYIHNVKTQLWVLLSWLGAYSRMVVFLFDPGGMHDARSLHILIIRLDSFGLILIEINAKWGLIVFSLFVAMIRTLLELVYNLTGTFVAAVELMSDEKLLYETLKDYFTNELAVLFLNQSLVKQYYVWEIGYLSASIESIANAEEGGIQDECESNVDLELQQKVTCMNSRLFPIGYSIITKRFWEPIYGANNKNSDSSHEGGGCIRIDELQWMSRVAVVLKSFLDNTNISTCLNHGECMNFNHYGTSATTFLFDPGGSKLLSIRVYLRTNLNTGTNCSHMLGVRRVSCGWFIILFLMSLTTCRTSKLCDACNIWHFRGWNNYSMPDVERRLVTELSEHVVGREDWKTYCYCLNDHCRNFILVENICELMGFGPQAVEIVHDFKEYEDCKPDISDFNYHMVQLCNIGVLGKDLIQNFDPGGNGNNITVVLEEIYGGCEVSFELLVKTRHEEKLDRNVEKRTDIQVDKRGVDCEVKLTVGKEGIELFLKNMNSDASYALAVRAYGINAEHLYASTTEEEKSYADVSSRCPWVYVKGLAQDIFRHIVYL